MITDQYLPQVCCCCPVMGHQLMIDTIPKTTEFIAARNETISGNILQQLQHCQTLIIINKRHMYLVLVRRTGGAGGLS